MKGIIRTKNFESIYFKHFCAWLVYLLYIYLINYVANHQVTFVESLLFILPFCIAFYSNLFSLNLSRKYGILVSILLIVTFFIFLSLISYYYIFLFLPARGIKLYDAKDGFGSFLRSAILGEIQYLVYALLYFVVVNSLKKEKRLRIIQEEKFNLEQVKMQQELQNSILVQQSSKFESERLEFQYAFLRSQINPHFLHNTLNLLYSQAMLFSDDLAENIIKLSNIMRYALESSEFETVTLRNEIKNLNTLLDINRLRFGDSMLIEYTIDGEIGNHLIPPLTIITIVENAFKHGDLQDKEQPLKIQFLLKPNQLYFLCLNKKRKYKIDKN